MVLYMEALTLMAFLYDVLIIFLKLHSHTVYQIIMTTLYGHCEAYMTSTAECLTNFRRCLRHF